MSSHCRTPFCLVLLVVGLTLAPPAGASGQEGGGEQLGEVDFAVSCSPAAQAEFDRAVALLHHMTYPQARESFLRVAEIDRTCAMAQWGFAMTLFQPLWPTRPGPDELQQGWRAVQRARDLGAPTERERLFIEAAAAFFDDPDATDYWSRIARWEEAMKAVHDTFPDDTEATAFFALAELAVATSGTLTGGDRELAVQLLVGICEAHPDHPGALHYLIHASDAPGHESDFPEVVQRYEAVAPRNPHALHMPTHIYTRLGDWDAVIRGNLRAADAALEHPAGPDGELVWDEFPHAIEYLVYANLQQGNDREAAAQMERLLTTENLQPTSKTAFHLASVQARYALERHEWGEAAALEPRQPAVLDWDAFPWPEAIAWFARGLGEAHQEDLDAAHQATARVAELEQAALAAGEELFGRHIRILRLELDAWIEQAEGNAETAFALMQSAADLEASTPKPPVTPAPTLPAAELLGDLFIEHQEYAEALQAYQRSLELYPNRFNSLLGAARAARGLADEEAAAGYYSRLLEIAASGTRTEPLAEARDYLDR
ncbi:MAG: hypothetical protein PVJ51_10235 [Acidobacteriota bacterium]|jgi:tetratricopeptide (TPR) repeat protein